MRLELVREAMAALARFSSATRLYALDIEGLAADTLLVEAFAADDRLDHIGTRDVIAVSTSAHLDLGAMLGKPARLLVSLADGALACFAGEISVAARLGSEGGLARYRLRLSQWIWRLEHVRTSRVWQDKSVVDIVDDVFSAYAPDARWRWSDEVSRFLADVPERSYCCQYRESDFAFVERLLAEEGLSWRFEQAEDGPTLVLFADSRDPAATPTDPSSPVRFHGAHARERSDTVQALAASVRLAPSRSAVLSYDYKAKKAVAASSPSQLLNGGPLPPLESFDAPGQYAYPDGAVARHYADLAMEAHEARAQLWRGRSTVRTLRAGTRFTLTGAPLARLGPESDFTLLRVTSVGVNNLPSKAIEALAELFGPIPELLRELVRLDVPEQFGLAVEQAVKSGYANCFDAVAADVVWRPQVLPRPTARGAQSAIVVGADGGATAAGADEVHCDRLGRVRIRFHWQDGGNATCWVRVAQRLAGAGSGSQFLPRIGQEVLVQFIENDIDRPLVVGALYNGQGEGGVVPSPGGPATQAADTGLFAAAHDQGAAGQGNLAAGNSPVWHGAAGGDAMHRNAAAQWGVRTKEFGGAGYNQLLFDDTDAEGRVQLRTTAAATELNLGHLVHSADNYRGSLRGHGAELRTDAWGAVRGAGGLLVSSYRIAHGAAARDPAGDNAAGIALIKQAAQLAATFNDAAVTHATVGLAAHLGATGAGTSSLDVHAAPLPALVTALCGMVGAQDLGTAQTDAGARRTAATDGTLPHLADPVVAMSARAGLGITAGDALQLANGETISVMSGQDTQFVSGGHMRVHTGQALGMLGGAVQPGEQGSGIQVIAAAGSVDLQAQGDVLKVQARDDVDVISVNASVDWAAASSISLTTAGGAQITISGGNITMQCPGKLTIHAGRKSFVGGDEFNYKLPILPQSVCLECLAKRAAQRTAFVNKGS